MSLNDQCDDYGMLANTYDGVTHVSWWHDEYGYSAGTTSRSALAATGAGWMGLLVTWYMDTKSSSTIARIRVPDQWYGDYLAGLGSARVAERRLEDDRVSVDVPTTTTSLPRGELCGEVFSERAHRLKNSFMIGLNSASEGTGRPVVSHSSSIISRTTACTLVWNIDRVSMRK